MATRVTCCHSLSLVVPLIVIRCHSLYHSLSLDVPLVGLFINDQLNILNVQTFQLTFDFLKMSVFLLLYYTNSFISRNQIQLNDYAHFRNFANFTGKHLCHSLYFDKVAGLTLLQQRLWHKYFPVNFPKFLRTLFHTEHCFFTASS